MSDSLPQSKLKKGVIRLTISDTRELYQAFMPFVDGCGLFFATEETYKIEQEVFVLITLPENMGKFAAPGRIVWLNPPKKAVKRVPGIGIQIRGREVEKIRETIETGLGKMLTTGLPSATL
ncbi:PilZ domain-containing protein [Dichelobacter nodosus]|uniref:Type IV fimbrial biogenesis protein PilZ n=1 Tax=Dichelobacter nodosus (strain VCS1703A) TaxID=246195 RepID=A5EXC8_DICNV|nr:PilZ domain-containing protein [Dichelobacter nodosus]ABQ13171.1 type IV fimbrial biogenesis protein PilZ [Dichelobacter nodosus VCS1703A]AXM45984.1 pilus assembly protein PilZ [Dichelobacter nodosus]KNZ39141.1 pilus assembly protein PilZ [Dichelobacter nodosus]TGA64564.1 pilus assembly protein PilZ [Dichelobacter nodosus]